MIILKFLNLVRNIASPALKLYDFKQLIFFNKNGQSILVIKYNIFLFCYFISSFLMINYKI